MRGLTDLPQSLLLLLATVSSTVAIPFQQWDHDGQVVLDSASSGRRGAVACESKVCSQIGIDLIALGGNAVDAFIGTQLCVGVIGMYHSGLGGGGFSLIRDRDGEYTVIDYRESAPAAAFQDMYQGNRNGSIFGGLAAGVPGELRGLELAHTKFGDLPWSTVVQPAADVARDGFLVTPDTIKYMEAAIQMAGWNFLVEDPSWAQDFAPNGTLIKLGDTMYRKRYADTLQKVADNGADVFYTGEIAEATIASLQKQNGTMTLQDLAEYKAIIRPSVNITYRGINLYSAGSPSSGVVGLSALKTLEGYDAAESKADMNLTWHRFDEAMRFAYGARQSLGDPDYVTDTDIALLEQKMLDAGQAATIRGRILDNATQPVENYDSEKVYVTEGHGTSHIVTLDGRTGMAVSSTTTINLLFGNLIMVPETGVVLNNEMDDFSVPGRKNAFGFEPSPANFIRAGKRPLSSITPIIAEFPSSSSPTSLSKSSSGGSKGRVKTVVGAAGGSRIISATTQVLWHVLEDHSPTMRHAIAHPRLHDQLMPNEAVFEYSFDNATVATLAARGHKVTWVREGVSAVQGILVDGLTGVFEAASETRQASSGGLVL
ncbi:gamma-glutamyltransferase [Xylariaceae sp. FL0594]|nr:gamma-glutamyltransferase [Xylariaceae sp. FL0594]